MGLARASSCSVSLALALLAVSCLASEFDAQLAEAERLRMQAAELGYEWLETAKLLEHARTEAANGNLDAAAALVEKARFQASAAIKQAKLEADAWSERVPR